MIVSFTVYLLSYLNNQIYFNTKMFSYDEFSELFNSVADNSGVLLLILPN